MAEDKKIVFEYEDLDQFLESVREMFKEGAKKVWITYPMNATPLPPVTDQSNLITNPQKIVVSVLLTLQFQNELHFFGKNVYVGQIAKEDDEKQILEILRKEREGMYRIIHDKCPNTKIYDGRVTIS